MIIFYTITLAKEIAESSLLVTDYSAHHFILPYTSYDFINVRKSFKCVVYLGTHSLENVLFEGIEPGKLKVVLNYFNHSIRKWSFLCLLLCNSSDCDEINYENSTYILMKTSEYNISNYSSGYYQVFAFDVNSSGAINPSNGFKVYTAFYSLRMNFTISQPQKSKLQLVIELNSIHLYILHQN